MTTFLTISGKKGLPDPDSSNSDASNGPHDKIYIQSSVMPIDSDEDQNI